MNPYDIVALNSGEPSWKELAERLRCNPDKEFLLLEKEYKFLSKIRSVEEQRAIYEKGRDIRDVITQKDEAKEDIVF